MSNKKFIILVVSFFILTISLVIIVNYIIDPFQQYSKTNLYKVGFAQSKQRYLNPGLAKNYEYNSIIAGSSMTENFLISKSREILNNPIKLCISGASAHEIFLILNTALKTDKKIETILIGLDIYSVSGKKERLRNGKGSIPLYLYDKNIFNDYLYLLNFDTLVNSIKAVIRPIVKKNDILYNYENMYQWQHIFEHNFGKMNVIRQFEEYEKNKKDKFLGYNYENFKNSFEHNFISLVKEYPNIDFIFFYPPYSILNYKLWQEYGVLKDILKFKEYAFFRFLDFPNVKIYDFHNAFEVTTNLDKYRDLIHYHQDVNTWIIDQIKRNNYLLHSENIERYNNQLLVEINKGEF